MYNYEIFVDASADPASRFVEMTDIGIVTMSYTLGGDERTFDGTRHRPLLSFSGTSWILWKLHQGKASNEERLRRKHGRRTRGTEVNMKKRTPAFADVLLWHLHPDSNRSFRRERATS